MTQRSSRRTGAMALVALAASGACHTAPAPTAAPVPVSATVSATSPDAMTPSAAMPMAQAAKPDSAARHGYTLADVRFMQHMIGHHAQALVMTALVPTHSTRSDMRLLAERITITQRDEIRMMQRWLRVRGERVPDPLDSAAHSGAMMHDMAAMSHDTGAMAGHDMGAMPGMLTPAQLAALGAASGPAFDRLFLQDMIRHHEGALVMAAALMNDPRAAQEPEIFRFANDVDADQRAEIERMQALLRTMPDESH